MAVSVVSEEEHPETPRLRLVETAEDVRPREDYVPPPGPAPAAPSFPTKEVVAILTAISMIISARLVLLLAFIANGALFYLATSNPSIGSISGASLFALLVFWPIAWLSLKKG